MSYTLEQEGVLELGLVRQHRHDACAHMGLAGGPDTFYACHVSKETYKGHTVNIAYRLRGRVVVVCPILIGRPDVRWITLRNHRLRDVFQIDVPLVTTSHMRILKYETRGT